MGAKRKADRVCNDVLLSLPSFISIALGNARCNHANNEDGPAYSLNPLPNPDFCYDLRVPVPFSALVAKEIMQIHDLLTAEPHSPF